MKNEARPDFAPQVIEARPAGRSPLKAFLIALPMMVVTYVTIAGRHAPAGAAHDSLRSDLVCLLQPVVFPDGIQRQDGPLPCRALHRLRRRLRHLFHFSGDRGTRDDGTDRGEYPAGGGALLPHRYPHDAYPGGPHEDAHIPRVDHRGLPLRRHYVHYLDRRLSHARPRLLRVGLLLRRPGRRLLAHLEETHVAVCRRNVEISPVCGPPGGRPYRRSHPVADVLLLAVPLQGRHGVRAGHFSQNPDTNDHIHHAICGPCHSTAVPDEAAHAVRAFLPVRGFSVFH